MRTQLLNLLKGNEKIIITEGLDTRLSIQPFVDYLSDKAKNITTIKSAFIQFVLEQFAKHPDLDKDLTLEKITQYQHLLDLIFASLSVSVEDEEEKMWALCAPIQPMIFYGTNAFYDLLLDERTGELKQEVLETQLEIIQTKRPELIYTLILHKQYNVANAFKTELVRTLIDQQTGLRKYIRLNFDMRFLNVVAKEEKPQLSNEQLQNILHGLKPLETLFQVLPIHKFRFEGLSVVTLTDVTAEYSIENIKNVIVNRGKDPAGCYYETIVESLKCMVSNNAVEFGMLPMLKVNDKLVFNESTCLNSILINTARAHGIAEEAYLGVAEHYFKNPKLLFFKTIAPEDEARQIYLKLLKEDGIVSYALIPIFYNNKLAGVLEVYSRQENVLTDKVIARLDPSIPLIAQVLQANIDDFNSHIDTIVKEKFTSLQPSVQWKFNEAAWLYLKKMVTSGKNPSMNNIFFRDVYPLYGAVDIRNSTLERNDASKRDLETHYKVLQETLASIRDKTNLPIIGELIFKCRKRFGSLLESDTGNEAISVHDFLHNEVDPVLSYFSRTNMATVDAIRTYYQAVDEHSGVAYENRRQLEQSMEMVTGAVNNYLEMFINEEKQSFPFYFEKFRTDGIEYDVYIGQSIHPDVPFDLLYLKNLRLWQVASMAAIAKLTYHLQPQMPKHLETTQLIFSNSHTIDISFRNDERRFDVEGAYNIRYQIIKKRIDKVCIKGTNERLTQVGKIAIIYFNSKDADEYIKYIQYLQEQDTLLNDLEELELEELQGVRGLKALRVGVNMELESESGEWTALKADEALDNSESRRLTLDVNGDDTFIPGAKAKPELE
jgi:hypothetical protein